MSKNKKSNNNPDITKDLEHKYKQIKQLVLEYNKTASDNKIDSVVGCIISPSERGEDYEDEYGNSYSTEGWMPSTLGC
jgi:hypothetical protein